MHFNIITIKIRQIDSKEILKYLVKKKQTPKKKLETKVRNSIFRTREIE